MNTFLHRFSSWNLLFILAIALNVVAYLQVDIIYVLVFLAGACLTLRNNRSFTLRPFELNGSAWNILIMIWVAANITGLFASGSFTNRGWHDTLDLRWILSFFACVYLGKSVSNIKLLLKLLGGVSTLVLGASILWYLKHPNVFGRISGFYSNPNDFALAVLFLWAFFFGWFASALNDLKSNAWMLAPLAFMTVIIYETYTRGAWLAMLVVIAFITLIGKTKRLLTVSAISLFGIILIYAFNLFQFKDRILYSLNITAGNSQALRLMIWKVSVAIFKDFPTFGVGFTENRYLFPAYYKNLGFEGQEMLLHSHNMYLQILNDSGLVGFLAFCGVLITALTYFYRVFNKSKNVESRSMALAGLAILIAFMTGSLVDCPLLSTGPRNYLFLLVGLSVGYCLQHDSEICHKESIIS
ncbi:O-antigen ligase [Bdellovibrio sp. NC01]|uniref:O-antigen ligase family protein n=1 Tax=Bdellovibrio sp. NC01 TaxID=2220073 RepID=UPI00143D34C7|nr:O-antigen ligase family protein [Bdellovibrio sp. NC01]